MPAVARTLALVGMAQALTFADVEYNGDVFFGVDDDGALDIVP